MKKKTKIIIAVCVFACLFFGVGVPILINELYKLNKGYVTIWSCGELLDFYGSLLGSVATIAALIFTILFTKKQITTDRYIASEKNKWEETEKIFDEAIFSLDPSILTNSIDLFLIQHDLNKLLYDFNSYLLRANSGILKIKIKTEEEPELSDLCIVFSEYMKKWSSCSQKIIAEAKKKETDINLELIFNDISLLSKSDYSEALKAKSKFFSEKYKSIVNEANNKLN